MRVESRKVLGLRKITYFTSFPFPSAFASGISTKLNNPGSGLLPGTKLWGVQDCSTPGTLRLWEGILGGEATLPGAKVS